MVKIKMFASNDITKLEHDVNNWTAAYRNSDIININYQVDSQGFYRHFVCITYRGV